MAATQHQCPHCHTLQQGNYCHECGRSFTTKRLSLGAIIHEAFHFFTHLDHGFPFTVKRLITAPGTMQREYIEGDRQRYQKPFSMFFLSATIAALAIYWINVLLIQHFHAGDSGEAAFFHKYWAFLQVALLPVYALITWLFFRSSKLFYGEIIVFQLYVFAFLFLMLTAIHLLKFAFPHLQTRYIELPAILAYCIVTNLNFFREMPRWLVVILSILCITVSFAVASGIQDFLVKLF